MCEIPLKLKITAPERRHDLYVIFIPFPSVSIVDFERVKYLLGWISNLRGKWKLSVSLKKN